MIVPQFNNDLSLCNIIDVHPYDSGFYSCHSKSMQFKQKPDIYCLYLHASLVPLLILPFITEAHTMLLRGCSGTLSSGLWWGFQLNRVKRLHNCSSWTHNAPTPFTAHPSQRQQLSTKFVWHKSIQHRIGYNRWGR